jgi:hypothetical protein
MKPPIRIASRVTWIPGRRSGLALAIVVLSALIGVLASYLASNSGWWPAIGVWTALDAGALIFVLKAQGFSWQSGPVAYLLVLWMFHFPLTLFVSLGISVDTLPARIVSWVNDVNWFRGAGYANACAACFVLGCLLALRQRRAAPRGLGHSAKPMFYCGAGTAVLGMTAVLLILLDAGGLAVFSISYSELYRAGVVFGAQFTIACFLVSVGVSMAILNTSGLKRWLFIVLQLAVTFVVLMTGARSYALMGALILVVLMAKAGMRLRPTVLAVGTLAALLVISAVGAIRTRGVASSSLTSSQIGAKAALAEMGGSLKTVALAFSWTDNGDQIQWGGGYWLPFERGIGVLVPGLRRELSSDPRAMSELLSSRVSGLGGSAVAESFYNFGTAGVLVFMVFGFVVAYMSINAYSRTEIAFESVLLYTLILEVRNWFISVPAMIIIGCVPIVVGRLLSGNGPSKRKEST